MKGAIILNPRTLKMKTNNIEHNLGDRVSLSGLRKIGMNGKRGTIVSLPDASDEGRYGVRVDGSRKPVAIKPANILVDKCETSKQIQEGAKDQVLLQKGDRVTLGGLKTSDLNGQQGIVVSPSDPSNEGRYGVRINGMRKPMGIKPENLRLVKKSTLQYKKERDAIQNLETRTSDEYLNADQMSMMRMLMENFSSDEQQIEVFGRKIEPMPDFRLEMINEGGGFPKFVDHAWANNLLRQAYEEDSALPHMHQLYFEMPDYEPDQKDFMKRLRTNDPTKLEWYFSPRKPGDIFEKCMVALHGDCMLYSFSNQAYKKQVLSQGKTHVAVGFVDLGIIMAADIDKRGDSPLQFVGIDSSPYIVAKTLLIWELIQHAAVMTGGSENSPYMRYITQVWFSTTWSKGTDNAVREALTSLLLSKGKKVENEVRSILEHWHKAPIISLRVARAKLQSLKNHRSVPIGILARQCDRIDASKYVLTGDFCVPDPICGNIILLDCPDGTPPPPNEETVFSALDFHDVMHIVNEKPWRTIMDAAETYALKGVAKLVRRCANNQISVELKCCAVQDAIDEIANRKPWTMSWSNVLDYVDHHEFHQLARECSRHGDTIHFGYSMNWTEDVWGTCLIDYAGKESTELRREFIETSNKAIRALYGNLGWDSYLRFPLPENPINTVGKLLKTGYYRDWTEHFFSYARRDGLFCEVGTVEPEIVSPLSNTGDSTVSFLWTYDPNVTLRGIPRPS